MMFMSFKLNDAETRYSNIERECLIIMNALTKIRWLVLNNQWKTICYTNHHALNSIMIKDSKKYEKIIIWQNRLKEYDIKIMHKSFTNVMIKITNELNRLSTTLITKYRIRDEEKSSMNRNNENESMKTKNKKRWSKQLCRMIERCWRKRKDWEPS